MRLLFFLAIALLALTHAARAEPPFVAGLYDVKGVTSDDVLNIRAEATARSEIIGELAHNARGIEVVTVTEDRRWGLVRAGEAGGWTSMAYLERVGITTTFPEFMICAGTEPFWALELGPSTAKLSEPAMDPSLIDLTPAAVGGRLPGTAFAFHATGPGMVIAGTVLPAECSDGMSDRPFGWSIGVVRDSADGVSAQMGCCALDER